MGKKPVPHIASSRTSTGGTTGVKPAASTRSRASDTRAICTRTSGPQQVGEAAARHPGGGLQVERARGPRELHVVARGEPERRRLADAAHLDGVLLAPVGGVVLGEVRQRQQQLVALGLLRAQLLLEPRELLAQAPGLGLLGGALAPLALRLPDGLADAGPLRPRRLDPRAQGPRGLVELQQPRHLVAGAAPREVGGDALRLGADQLEVEQGAGSVRPRRRPGPGRGPRRPSRGRPRTRRRGAAR